MLTQEDDVDAHALRKRGWSISAIARHLGHDRKTIRAYLNGERAAGVRAPAVRGPFDPFVDYCRERLRRGSASVGDDVVRRGRRARLRPVVSDVHPPAPGAFSCARIASAAHAAKGRPVAIIDHPAGEETQWDWVDLPDPPPAWGWGANASLFVGALAHSGRWRGRLAESKDQPHTIDALDQITRALGGLTQGVAFRSDGHRLPSADRACDGVVRWCRQALRGVGRDLPAAAREPQRRRRESQRHRRATLVADPARRHHDRTTRRRRWTGSVSVSVTPADVSSTANATPSPPMPRASG